MALGGLGANNPKRRAALGGDSSSGVAERSEEAEPAVRLAERVSCHLFKDRKRSWSRGNGGSFWMRALFCGKEKYFFMCALLAVP